MLQTWLGGGPSPSQQMINTGKQMTSSAVTTTAPTVYGGAPKAAAPASPGQQTVNMPNINYPSAPSMPSFEEIYAPLFSSLSQQEAAAKSDLGDVQASIERQGSTATSELQQAQEAQNKALTGQVTDVEAQRANALQQARQLYSELSQYNQARFGSGSSAGPAAMELLGRETSRQFGNVEQTTTRAKAEIEDKRYQLNRFTQLEQKKITDQIADKLAESRQQYNQRVIQISTARNQLESQKLGSYMQEAQNYAARIQALQDWKLQQVLGLAVWNSQQQAALTKTLAEVPSALTGEQMQGYLKPISQAPSDLAYNASVKTPTFVPATTPTPYSTKTSTTQPNPLNPFENLA